MQFAEADMDTTELAIDGQNNRYKGDDLLAVKFSWHAKKNQTESDKQGRPIFKDVAYVTIMSPGNKDSIVKRPATEMDIARFAKHYKLFMDREDQSKIEGVPLSEWPCMTRSMVEELKYYNIQTVEQLAGVSDSNAQGIMGIAALKQKAADYLVASKDEATSIALAAADNRLEALEARLEELSSENKRLVEGAAGGDQAAPAPLPVPPDMAAMIATAVAAAMPAQGIPEVEQSGALDATANSKMASSEGTTAPTADISGSIEETPEDKAPAAKPAGRRRRTAKTE